jgi:GDP-L-fucose synthase
MSGTADHTMAINLATSRIVVTGGAGFLGRAVCSKLQERGCRDVHVPRRAVYDLTSEEGTRRMYRDLRPEIVLHLAAEVGGIGANQASPGRYFYANMAMALHLIEQARVNRVRRFVQVGTACAYPRDTPVPFREEDLWNGYPEETNAPYGVAKRATAVMLDAYRRQYGLRSAFVLPVNLFGPNDSFDPQTSHVIPALIRKCVEAADSGADTVECWGTGEISREFLYVDDAAEGVIRAAERMEDPLPINLGTGREIRIRELAALIARLAGFRGKLRWDASKPDGQPRRSLDTQRAAELLGWRAETDLEDGLRRTITWYRSARSPASFGTS